MMKKVWNSQKRLKKVFCFQCLSKHFIRMEGSATAQQSLRQVTVRFLQYAMMVTVIKTRWYASLTFWVDMFSKVHQQMADVTPALQYEGFLYVPVLILTC